MNILHLKYAVEVAKTKSISKAAENLYMGQPNLSRAIKELETRIGTDIFVRTMRGITVTPEGEHFLEYARRIVAQVDELENMYENGKLRQRFSVYSVSGTCAGEVVAKLAKDISREAAVDIFYREGSNDDVIDAVFGQEANIGIIRCKSTETEQYRRMLADKKLESQSIFQFEYRIAMSKTHSLAQKMMISLEELQGYSEIICENTDRVRKELTAYRHGRNTSNRIYVPSMTEACSMLNKLPGSYMWAGAISEDVLSEQELVTREADISSDVRLYEDMLVWRAGYILTDMDKKFISII